MYLCPVCGKALGTEEAVVKHALKCWREKNRNHASTPAPKGPDVVECQMNDDVANFFAMLQKEKNNAGSNA